MYSVGSWLGLARLFGSCVVFAASPPPNTPRIRPNKLLQGNCRNQPHLGSGANTYQQDSALSGTRHRTSIPTIIGHPPTVPFPIPVARFAVCEFPATMLGWRLT